AGEQLPRLQAAGRPGHGHIAHRRGGVAERLNDERIPQAALRGMAQRLEPAGQERGGAGHQVRNRSACCRRDSDSPASPRDAPLICSTATRFCRDTEAIDSIALTIMSPPRFCSPTASDIWWVSRFIFSAAWV